MGKLQWYYNRLRAMNVREVIWRLDQKRIQKSEASQFGNQKINIGMEIWPKYKGLVFNPDALGVYYQNQTFDTNTEIHLLKGADYNKWPETFSYKLDYKQRDDLGDARSNWEKNRHFDWALLAKAYYVLKDENLYNQLEKTISDWMEKNPFLHGISWTSAMEFAIRSINWMVTLAFLKKSLNHESSSIESQLQNGIVNIIDYLTKHYSRYSSANNHLLVEATAIGLAGYAFGYDAWKSLATRILTEELENQNYSDGVNKELSLHYQTFGMEAYLLLAHIQEVNGDRQYCQWLPMLKKEAEFVAHSSWREKTVCEFGDDDEGKILDLQGGEWHQWEWVLQLASLVTGTRYSSFDTICENARWLFSEHEIESIRQKPLYRSTSSRIFSVGGNSFLRDTNDRVLIGIDHAALGFGSIAAHGHADALSFQLMIDGTPVLVDPGTFIYHCDLEHRNSFRKTINHNTLCVEGKDQSQMLGAFLWGERANSRLIDCKIGDEKDTIIASHDGYRPCIHSRSFEFDKSKLELTICDTLSQEQNWISTLMLGVGISAKIQDNQVIVDYPTGSLKIEVTSCERIALEDTEVSPEYGVKLPTKAIRIYGHSMETSLSIKIELK